MAVNVTMFYDDFRDIPLSTYGPVNDFNHRGNVTRPHSQGAELEVRWAPIESLNVTYSPKFQTGLGLDYVLPTHTASTWRIGGNASYESQVYTNIQPARLQGQPGDTRQPGARSRPGAGGRRVCNAGQPHPRQDRYWFAAG